MEGFLPEALEEHEAVYEALPPLRAAKVGFIHSIADCLVLDGIYSTSHNVHFGDEWIRASDALAAIKAGEFDFMTTSVQNSTDLENRY